MFAEFDAPSKNLKQALYKVIYNGKYLTEDQRTRFYKVLTNYPYYNDFADRHGHDFAVEQIVSRSTPEGSISKIKSTTQILTMSKKRSY